MGNSVNTTNSKNSINKYAGFVGEPGWEEIAIFVAEWLDRLQNRDHSSD
jgi:hypothetical protein